MPAFTTTERLKMLEHVMLHKQLTDADRRIYWYLVIKLLNEETGLTYCANAHLAKQLSLTTKTVRRCKKNLKQLSLLTYTSGKTDHTATSYKLIKQLPTGDTDVPTAGSTKMFIDVRGTRVSPVPDTHVPSTGDTDVPSKPTSGDAHVPRSNRQQTGSKSPGYFAMENSPEWNYWNAFLRRTTGKGALLNKAGGWYFPTQWPSETTQ
jgi:hypothetical protein